MLSISAQKPISNNLSASSNIKNSTSSKSIFLEFLFISTILPGVAITKSGTFLSSVSYFANGAFPITIVHDNLV